MRGSGNRLLLHSSARPPAAYAMRGWLEIALNGRGRAARGEVVATLNSLNFTADREEPDELAPASLHIGLEPGPRPRGGIDLATGRGRLAVPVAISYPGIERDPWRKRRSQRDLVEPWAPLRSTMHVAFRYDLESGGFTAGWSAEVEGLSVAHSTLAAFTACICRRKSYCLEMCVHVWVSMPKRDITPIIVESIRDQVHEIWGCRPNGQCCIRFKFEKIDWVSDLPRNPIFPHAEAAGDFEQMVKEHRSKDCYDLYLVGTMRRAGKKEHGLTFGQEGSMVATYDADTGKERDTDDIARTVAHELGHGLSLDDLKNADNLMGKGRKLTPDQCNKARSSSKLTADEKFECAPRPKQGYL
jgi:hypothetical protein